LILYATSTSCSMCVCSTLVMTHPLIFTLFPYTTLFRSRSRGTLWKKGETSGNLQSVVELRTDCDQDALWLKVRVAGDGPTCHTRSEEHTSELQSRENLVCRLLLEKKNTS